MFFRKAVGYTMIPLCCLLLVACSSGGGGGDTPPDPATGNNWDQMEWDKGSWS